MRAFSFILILVAASLVQSATLTPLGDASSNKLPYLGAIQNIDAGSFNFTAAWFNGAFNWTESSVYLSFDGSTLDFNDTLLNETIDAKLASTTYFPTEYFTLYGTESGGNNIGNLSFYDNEFFNITEDGGGDALEFYVNFTGVTDFNNLLMRERYLGGNGHEVVVEIYDTLLSDWEGYLSITDQAGQVVSNTPVTDPLDHIIDGVVQLRFRHIQNGIASHKLIIDYIQLINGSSTITNIDHDGLSGRDEIENHPWAFPTAASRNITGNVNVTANVSAELFIGLMNCSNITEAASDLCTLEDTDTDTWWGLNEGYIYNNSDSLDFNETLLNATIEALSDVDTDTVWDLNTSYLFNNSGLLDFNESHLNATIEALDSDTTYSADEVFINLSVNGVFTLIPEALNDTHTHNGTNITGVLGDAQIPTNLVRNNTANNYLLKAGEVVSPIISTAAGNLNLNPAGIIVLGKATVTDQHYGIQVWDSTTGTQNVELISTGAHGYLRTTGVPLTISTNTGDIILEPAGGDVYIGSSLSAPTSKALRAKTLYSDTGGVTAWDVENDTFFDTKKLKEIKEKTVDGKSVWDLSGIVKKDSEGKVIQSVLETTQAEETELRNVTRDGETFMEYVGTGNIVNSTWVNNAELNGYLIGVLKAQQLQIENLTLEIQSLREMLK